MSNSATLRIRTNFLGTDHPAARVQLSRALDAGMSVARAYVLANIASFRDGWVPRRTIAKYLGICVKTVQRGINDGRAEGLLGVARAKEGEIPPGRDKPFDCGWSHRWMIARETVGEAARAAIAAWKVKMLQRAARLKARPLERKELDRREQKRRLLTDDDRAELERIDRDSRRRELGEAPD